MRIQVFALSVATPSTPNGVFPAPCSDPNRSLPFVFSATPKTPDPSFTCVTTVKTVATLGAAVEKRTQNEIADPESATTPLGVATYSKSFVTSAAHLIECVQ